MLTKVYFVRHAQPVHSYADDRTRPLTEEGIVDSKLVLQTLKDKNIDVFYCSPYKRSLDTIRGTADYYKMNIQTDERLREREAGVGGSVHGMYQKRWANHNFHEDGGESIEMVQQRNIEALKTILKDNEGKNIVIGTHGTALSSIINYYLPEFGCDDFLRIIDWMPYIVEIDFEGQKLISIHEHAHIEK
jgi:2,3-bisphosphoglycerate-dependent phosphoglycerate mutase